MQSFFEFSAIQKLSKTKTNVVDKFLILRWYIGETTFPRELNKFIKSEINCVTEVYCTLYLKVLCHVMVIQS